MSKKPGFKITIFGFIPIDKKDFKRQAEIYAAMAKLQEPGAKLTPDLLALMTMTAPPKVGQGSAEVPDAPYQHAGDMNDLANWPLTADPLPEGATVLEASEPLDGSIMQRIKLASGVETMRRISAEQDAAEKAAATPAADTKKPKK
jgi:hypothetical protein